MFTGLIEELGEIKSIAVGADSAVLTVRAKVVTQNCAIGDSIAVNGVCLTVKEFSADHFSADVMAVTLKKSNLGLLKSGSLVNLERAAAVGNRLGGHIVSGHIDTTGEIIDIRRDDIALLYTIRPPEDLLRYIIRQGSVAIDGISLTVAELHDKDFAVSLIPHTAAVTTLGHKKRGDTVNLEFDVIGKYVERLLTHSGANESKSELSLNFLAENGFL